MHQMIEPFQDHHRAAKRNRHVLRDEAALARTEPQGAQSLQPPHVEFSRVVNTIQLAGQHAVGPQQLIALQELLDRLEIK